MKKLLLHLLIGLTAVLCLSPRVFSQSPDGMAWEWQNPLPTGNPINAVDFVDSLNGWFASSAGTILYTADGGESWQIQYTGVDAHFQTIDFVDQDHGWAAGQAVLEDGTRGGIITHTNNGGDDWTTQLTDSVIDLVEIITFLDRQHGWAGGDNHTVFFTSNGGQSWENVTVGHGGGRVLSISFVDTLRGWADGSLMPFLSTKDGGRTWKPDTTVSEIGQHVVFADSSHGWVIGFFGEVWRTVNGGKTWTGGMSIIPGQYPVSVFFVDSLVGWVSMGELEPGTYKTTDGAKTWDKVTSVVTNPMFFFDDLSGWLGFSRTYDGGQTLMNQTEGFTLTGFFDIDFLNKNIGWVAGRDGLIAKSIDGGRNWQVQHNEESFSILGLDIINENEAWAVGSESVILNTGDGGTTWQSRTFPSGSNHKYSAVTFVDSLTGWIAGSIILSTKDGGVTWIEQGSEDIGRFLTDLAFVNMNAGWAVGQSAGAGYIYHTGDGGENWNLQFEDSSHGLRSVFFLDENKGWAAGAFLIVGTVDGGDTWVVQDGGEKAVSNDIFFLDEHTGFACGIIGDILYTDNGGTTWQRQRRATTNILEGIHFVDRHTGWMVGKKGTILNTKTGGITSIDATSEPQQFPSGFRLLANYPNPFNAETVISYELPSQGYVRLVIYDVLGREVVTLLDSVQPAGVQKIVWHGKTKQQTDATSGLYFYRLWFEEHQKTGKMILLR